MAEENEHIDYELITKVLAGEASLDEVETVRHWREASKHNALAFSEMETLWNKAGKVMPHQKAQVDVDKGWQKLNARIDEIENSKVQQHSQGEVKNLYYYFTRVAAVLVVGLSLYWIYSQSFEPSKNMEIIATHAPQTDTLSDGSIVTLNINSRLSYTKSFGDGERKVVLQGEGYFDVAHDANKAFIIETSGVEITVLGTSFYVKAYDTLAQMTIGVKEGLVKVTTAHIEKTVEAGETIIIDNASKQLEDLVPFDPNALFWESGSLIFQNERLESVFHVLVAHYNTEIAIQDPSIANCRLTAKFYGEDIDQILESICASFDLHALKENDQYIISGSGCE